jgi:hypothetical protein
MGHDLTSETGRVGGSKNQKEASMKRIVFLVLAVTVLLSVIALGVYASPPGQPFTGVWESIDAFDGSQQRMAITPVGRGAAGYHLAYRDYGASACGVDANGQPLYAAIGTGTASAAGNTLNTEFEIWCLGRPRWSLGMWSSSLDYDAATDTLRDTWGGLTTEWHRQGGR